MLSLFLHCVLVNIRYRLINLGALTSRLLYLLYIGPLFKCWRVHRAGSSLFWAFSVWIVLDSQPLTWFFYLLYCTLFSCYLYYFQHICHVQVLSRHLHVVLGWMIVIVSQNLIILLLHALGEIRVGEEVEGFGMFHHIIVWEGVAGHMEEATM